METFSNIWKSAIGQYSINIRKLSNPQKGTISKSPLRNFTSAATQLHHIHFSIQFKVVKS